MWPRRRLEGCDDEWHVLEECVVGKRTTRLVPIPNWLWYFFLICGFRDGIRNEFINHGMRSFTSIIRDHFTIMALLIDRFLCNLCLLDDKFSIVASFLDSICILTCAFFVPLEGYSENVCGEIVRNVHSYKFIHISIFLFFFWCIFSVQGFSHAVFPALQQICVTTVQSIITLLLGIFPIHLMP